MSESWNDSIGQFLLQKIGAGFAIVPLLGIIETVAIGKAFGKQFMGVLSSQWHLSIHFLFESFASEVSRTILQP